MLHGGLYRFLRIAPQDLSKLARHLAVRDGDHLVLLETVDALSERRKTALPSLELRFCCLVQLVRPRLLGFRIFERDGQHDVGIIDL